ncbi:glycosyltransferase [Candidatus Woesearchaeota archaeon]|nr:glycosyltransferase [Candidatus Woesearchaeota archaeon]
MLSVIIPACNEEQYIKETIESIKKQNYKEYEIIVVCDGCTDKTPEIASKLADKVVTLKTRSGPAIAKNKGVEISKGNKLVFLDADTHLGKEALSNISEVLDNDINTIGTCKIKPSSNKTKHKIMMFLKNYLISPLGVSNGIIFCTKKLYTKFNGFNNGLKKREDGDFIRRIKKQGNFIILDNYVVSSTRRFDKKGYLSLWVYWLKEYIKPSDDHYEIIR